jgi:poly(A) polymerase
MVAPIVLPRQDHTLSRRDIDPDALKVLYRLHEHGHVAYLVGGSVRDLFIGRKPKDFDIGTSAHPYQVKRLFRNCWIIGRRFRLAHVNFGTKTIEVATFRRQLPAGTEAEPPIAAKPGADEPSASTTGHHARFRDNTFGTPEEDAFRRDFTVNALFYDIATFSIIDYVNGLADLRSRVIRSIGDPVERFHEDPVRMLRAVVLAVRLDFDIDPVVAEAIRQHGSLIAEASPARLLEEYYKILRSGVARQSFAALEASGLLAHLTPELRAPNARLEASLEALDRFRLRFDRAPDALTNAVLAGTLLVPLGLHRRRRVAHDENDRGPAPRLGMLPVARRDVERLTQAIGLQQRLLDLGAPPRAQRGVMHRSAFRDALTWLDVHGQSPEVVSHWMSVGAATTHAPSSADADDTARYSRSRRRRRRRRRAPVTVEPGHR